MTPDDAMREIESRAFALRSNIASGISSFLYGIAHEEAVEFLLDELRSPAQANSLLAKVLELAAEMRDSRFEHPRDTAIAAYLWLLAIKNPSSARLAASALTSVEGFWWARKVAQRILEQTQSMGSDVRAQRLVSHQRLVSQKVASWVDFRLGDDQALLVADVHWTPSTVRVLTGRPYGTAFELAFNAPFTFASKPPSAFYNAQSFVTDATSVETGALGFVTNR